MKLTIDNILLIGSILLFVSLVASRTTRFGIPTLLFFLFVGMLAGSDGPLGIYFYDPKTAKFIGSIALCFILFSGGLETKWLDIKPVLWQGISLSTLGVIISALTIGTLVYLFTDLSFPEGLLLGSIVSSTDAAAVFSILRSRNIGLKGNLRPLLELESGSNDPMAFVMTLIFTFVLSDPKASLPAMIVLFLKQMILGAVVGVLMGIAMPRIINWIKLQFEGLYSVLLISLVLFTFAFSNLVGGNAFLSVYISACILGNRDFIHKKSLTKHFDGQAWMMQMIMFITLGLLVFPKQIIPHIGIGILISVLLIFVARPISVFFSLSFSGLDFRKKMFVSWVGLRGAVPIVLAIYPLTAGVENAGVIFNLVFFISITSVLVQGTSIPMVAKWLNLTVPVNIRKKSVLDLELGWKTKSVYNVVAISEGFNCIGKTIVDLGLPNSVIIAMVERNNKYFISDGSTKLLKGDKLYIMADDDKSMNKLFARLGKPENER
jgi:potassium/hydrogen antiporter